MHSVTQHWEKGAKKNVKLKNVEKKKTEKQTFECGKVFLFSQTMLYNYSVN